MPRKKVWPPRVYPHLPSGQDRVRINGRDVYLGPIGSEESRQAYARILAEGVPPPAPVKVATVADVVAAWYLAEYPKLNGKEPDNYRLSLLPLTRTFGQLPARDFDTDHLEQLQLVIADGSWLTPDELEERRPGKETGCCRNVVNRRIVRVRTVWRWAERKGHVPDGRWAKLRTVRGIGPADPRVRQTPKRRPCTLEQLRAVRRHCPKAVATMLTLSYWSGMRPEEVRLLRPGEVERLGEVWIYRPLTHKNAWRGQERAVPLGKLAQRILTPWLAGVPDDAFVFRPGGPRAKLAFYSAGAYCLAVQRAREAAGVEAVVVPYTGRHSAKQRITRTLGLEAARQILGQKSVSQTNEYGDALDLDAAVEAARKLG